MKFRDVAARRMELGATPDDTVMVFTDDPGKHLFIQSVERDVEDDGSHTIAINVVEVTQL